LTDTVEKGFSEVSLRNNRIVGLDLSNWRTHFSRHLCPLWVDAVEKGFGGVSLRKIDSNSAPMTQQ